MKKIVKYLIRFIELTIITFIIIVTKSSTDVHYAAVENDNVNKNINLTTMALKVLEINENDKYSAKATFTGDLTGYAYDCPLCNGTLGCLPSYYIKDGRNTYFDYEYGKVYIVASSSKIACGSIIRFDSNRISDEKVYAIVLDRGVLGYDIDFLTPSEQYAADYIGRSVITYDVLRSGWE